MAEGIGRRIKKRRQALGIRTQKELADMVGVTRTTVSDWESGRHLPERFIGRLEEVLGSLEERVQRLDPELERRISELTPEQRDYLLDQLLALREEQAGRPLRDGRRHRS